MAQLNFQTNSVANPAMGYEPLPAGWYPFIITAEEYKPNKKGDGNYLQLDYTVADGQHKGKKVIVRLNLQNPNAQAVEIAYRELAALGVVLNLPFINDSSELLNKPFYAKVIVKPGGINETTGQQYGDGNEIKGYKNINEPIPGTGAAPAPGPTAPVPPKPPGAIVPPPANQAAGWTPPATTAPATPPVDPNAGYTLSPDKTHRWKEGMTAWEPVPAAAPPAPPAPPPPPANPAPPPPPGGQGMPAQPWANGPALAPPAATGPAAAPPPPPAPPGSAAAQAAPPPWGTVGQ